MKSGLNKSNGVRTEIALAARLCGKVVYINMTERSLTTSGTTVMVHWHMCQLVWLASTQIEAVNHLVHRVID